MTALVRSRDRARTAALQAEVVVLRAAVAGLRDELARVQAAASAAAEASAVAAEAAAAEAAEALAVAGEPAPRWLTLQLPLVRLALGDPAEVATGPDVAAALASPDRGLDTAEVEVVLETAPAPADRLAWSVLANLPERPLLDPTLDRDAEPRDPAAAREVAEHRRTA
jgi:hypothetical protein